MLSYFSDQSVALNNVSFNYFLKIIKRFLIYPKLRTNISANSFIRFFYINMNNIIFIKFPSKSNVVNTFG